MSMEKTGKTRYDVLIIGGGPGGYSAAASAAKAGLSVCLFEKERIGGTCLHRGCIPAKYLLDRAAALDKIRKMTKAGLLRNAGEFSFRAVMKEKQAVIDRLCSGLEAMLRSNRVRIVAGEAGFLDNKTLVCNGETYAADSIIISAGSSPVRLAFPGSEYCLDSSEALSMTAVPRRMCIIGGGVIGLELGSAYMSYGSSVHILELNGRLLPNELPEAAGWLVRKLSARGMTVQTSGSVKSVEKTGSGFTVHTDKGSFEADAVVSAAGRKPNSGIPGIENTSVQTDGRGCIAVNAQMRTTVDGIYAVGDITGGYMLAHAAYEEAGVAVAKITGNDVKSDQRFMPRCIYTIPPLASVGLTRTEAEKMGYSVTVGQADYRANGMAAAEGEEGCTFAVLDSKSRRCLGFSCVGAGAPEMINAASIALERGYTSDSWRHLIVAHPSVSETLREAVLSAE